MSVGIIYYDMTIYIKSDNPHQLQFSTSITPYNNDNNTVQTWLDHKKGLTHICKKCSCNNLLLISDVTHLALMGWYYFFLQPDHIKDLWR